MKIVHVISSLDPAGGGPPVVAAQLAASQAQLGHDLAIVVDQPADRRPDVRGLGAVDVRVIEKQKPWSRPGGELTAVLSQADAVHLHGLWEPLLLKAAAVAQSLELPYAVTPHGMLDPWSLGQKRWKKRLAMAIGYRRMLERAAFLHVLNDDEAQLIEPLALGVPTRRVPNGIDLEALEPLPEPGRFRAAHPAVGDAPFVLFLSRLHYKKGLDHLAESFAQLAPKLPALRLVVVGPDGGAAEDFRYRIAQHNLTDRVYMPGPLYGQDKLAALVDADCFCLPSRQEGFSVAILEALACGTPVVISENCHFPEVAEHGAGRVVPLERGALAAAIEQVIGSEAMGRAGRQMVGSCYTADSVASRMIEAYGVLSAVRRPV